MNKDQLQFLVSGILFGFLIGYIVAFGVHEPKHVMEAAPVPEAGNLGMSGGIGAAPPAGGGAGGPGGPGAGGGGNEQMMGQVFQEVAALKEAIEKDPKNLQALVRLANMYHDAGKFDQAIEYYQKALGVEPKDPNVHTDMGICLRELGRADEAIAQFRTSLQYQPEHWQSWLNLAVVTLFDTNDLKTATEALARVEQLNPAFKDLPLLKEELRKRKSS